MSSTAESRDVLVIGGGPAGAAVAMRAAAGGARVTVFEKGRPGRDKICGDGLTPRAVRALDALDVALDDAHRIDGLRMTANATVRQMDWPGIAPFPAHGAVWPRRRLDERLMERAAAAGAELLWSHDAVPVVDEG
ncbi:MAG TPA: FAD-dependent monooxygenase, partial [Microthrixaceae bacterium]|nr:FAD-dependent monooxygenase [Microthrixaceae bacterium]